jgi:hypothetical protein
VAESNERRPISTEGKISILLGLIGLGGVGALQVLAHPYNDYVGWTLIWVAIIGAVALGVYHVATTVESPRYHPKIKPVSYDPSEAGLRHNTGYLATTRRNPMAWMWSVTRNPQEVPCHTMTTPNGVLCRWWEGPGKGPWPKEEADARLIAAAPDMLEALQEIALGKGSYSRDPLQHASNCIDDMKALARAAIIKAIGDAT